MQAPSNRDLPARRRRLRTLLRDRRGATALEYGFIVALIVIAMIGSLGGVANTTVGMWNSINDKVTNAR